MNNIEEKKREVISELKARVDDQREEIDAMLERISLLQGCNTYLSSQGIMYGYLRGDFKIEGEKTLPGQSASTNEYIVVDPVYYTTKEDCDRFISAVRILENKSFNLNVRIVVL